jgi:A/G-specific adenine glycosylase
VSLGEVHAAVFDWYAANGRDLAFRQTRDPWAVLVSEVMAQQTQAARAAVAWERFIARFPMPAALADSSPADVIRAWHGLGYNRRAVALRNAAIRIVEDHGGRVPDSLEALQALPGIGPYTARAVLAFAFGRPVAPLDTNVRRVLARAFGPLPAGARASQAAADGYVPPADPAAWSHALMDIGATICVARNPKCDACPLRDLCRLRASGARASDALPIRRAGQHPNAQFSSTTRWLRGRILDRLRDAPDRAWVTFERPIGSHSLDAVTSQLSRMLADGLLEVGDVDPITARLVTSR